MDLAALSPLLETLTEGLIVVGPDLSIISKNRAAEEILGGGCEGLCRLPVRESGLNTRASRSLKQTISAVKPQGLLDASLAPIGTYHADGKIQYREHELPLQRALKGETVHSLEIVVRNHFRPEGVRLEINASPVRDATGQVTGAVCAFSDISDAHVSEQRHNVFRQVFAQTQEAIVITDAAFVVQYANQAYWDLTGNQPDRILNRPFSPQQGDYNEGSSWAEMKQAVKTEGRWSGEFVIRRLSNELLPLWATFHAVTDGESTVTNYVLTLSDLTSLKSSQEELYRLISKDALTGLSNRREFFEQLEKTIERAARLQEKFVLVSIDLQRFKELNDSLGHQSGDRVLQHVASRLSKDRQQDDAVARLGGDEFALIVSDCANDYDLALAIENIRKAIETPLTISGETITPTACIGVAVYPEDGQDASTLAKNVDIALASAASKGKALTRFFTDRMFENIKRQFWLENNLRNSFGTNQLVPYFQPQLNLVNNKPDEAEVLIRWNHPEAGQINPGEFIPVAERTGLIGRVTVEVMDASCKQMRQWRAEGLPLKRLAVNITAGLLLAPDFVSGLRKLLAHYSLRPSDLLIEITESSAMEDPDLTGAVLKQLKKFGITLAIDDFGTGYSSLAYLRKFAVDQIKIDQSFVRDLASSVESQTIVKAIIRMCETLGYETLAEGIETREQAMLLSEFGCKKLQGYLIARPLSGLELQDFMKANGAGMSIAFE
jgi:diguanylate cyclase (GGDEF)-like protein/PAS domain S-box-containing protein